MTPTTLHSGYKIKYKTENINRNHNFHNITSKTINRNLQVHNNKLESNLQTRTWNNLESESMERPHETRKLNDYSRLITFELLIGHTTMLFGL